MPQRRKRAATSAPSLAGRPRTSRAGSSIGRSAIELTRSRRGCRSTTIRLTYQSSSAVSLQLGTLSALGSSARSFLVGRSITMSVVWLTSPLTCGSANHDTAERRGARERDPVPSGAAVCYAAWCAQAKFLRCRTPRDMPLLLPHRVVQAKPQTICNADQFSRTIPNEPGRAAGRTTHPEFRVALQPSPCRVVPSSGPVTGTDSVAPSAERKTPPLALRRPH